ncbi:hypothetical protein SAMN05720354_10948 [Nitrosospira sp. Nsp1]|nr:hypothetical protein SAMN05720354_10948 [Nitrosospira sp. Nsp1]
MMARQVARQFCRLREVHSLVYGRRASGENGRKLTASTRVGSQSRLMNYLGLYLCPLIQDSLHGEKYGGTRCSENDPGQ